MFRKLISLSLAFVMLAVTAFAATDIVGLNAAYAAEESAGTLTVTNGKLFINGYGVQGTLSLKSAKDATANVVAAIFDDEGELLNAIIGADVELTAGTETPYPVTLDVPEEEAKDNSYAFYLWEKDTLVPLANSVSATATYGWTGEAAATAPATAVMDDGETYYQIKSPEDLAWFGKHVQGGATTANAVLCNDIYLNSFLGEDGKAMTELGAWYEDASKRSAAKRWWNGDSNNYGIGTKEQKYGGVFDGNDRVIHGLYIVDNKNTASYYSMFPYVNGATIKDLTIADAYHLCKARTAKSYSAGILVGQSSTTVADGVATNISNITIAGGKIQAENNECYFPYVGSIVAHAIAGAMNVTNCTSSITIDFSNGMPYTNPGNTLNMGAGGIVGFAKPSEKNYKMIIDGCSYTGHIALNSESTLKFGGILGQGADSSGKKGAVVIQNCTGNFTTNSANYVNALVGIGSNYTASNNTVTYAVVEE